MVSFSVALAISTLAQAGKGARRVRGPVVTLGQALVWIGLLLAFLVVGGGATHLLRRYLKRPGRREAGPAWTMTQLREMFEAGHITQKEYEALKRTVRAPGDR